jgi:membrane-associated protease RseP (regulator of RpoE activity)
MPLLSVLAAIAVLAVLIVVHELGHFLAARSQGIHVNQFSIGFGPALWKYQGTETLYAIRAVPLGGYVGFPDDDPDSVIPPNDPDLMRNRPIVDRAIVISAGVIANLIFAYLLLVLQAGTVGNSSFSPLPGVLVPQLAPEMSRIAQQAGIQPKDVIVAVNGQDLTQNARATESLRNLIQRSPSQPLDFTVQRGEQSLTVRVVPELDAATAKGMIGISLAPNGKITRQRPASLAAAFTDAARDFQRITVLTAQGFVQLASNFGETAKQVAGPVKIVQAGAEIAGSDAAALFQFAAIISINLAVINILPLPALDGGQLAFLLIEGLRGKPMPTEVQQNVMQTGLVLLLGLGIFLIVRDTASLVPSAWVANWF